MVKGFISNTRLWTAWINRAEKSQCMYDIVLKLPSPFKVEIYIWIHNMEREIYLSGLKTKLWTKFNMLLLKYKFLVSLEDFKCYSIAKPRILLSGRANCFLMTKAWKIYPFNFIFFSCFTFTCVETHCFWKWRCSGVSCKICISLPQTSGYLLTGCEREREERLPVLEPVTLVKMQCHKHQAIILIDVQHII